jgi:beta-glucosidase
MRARALPITIALSLGCTRSSGIEDRIAALLARMSLEEKVAEMHGQAQTGTFDGTYHTPDNTRLAIPGFHMTDGSMGVSQGTGHASAFPCGAARGATFDPDLEQRIGEAMSREARAKGANVLLAPVINVLRHPSWGRAQETYGEDPYELGVMGSAFIRGAQQNVIASAKHFAANSIEDRRFTVDVRMDERTLREVYLPHFRRAVEAGVGSVMSAYNKVNGFYCSENVHLLHDILKGEWGFSGFVESDWVLGTHSATASPRAGLDIEMPEAIYYGDELIQAAQQGTVPISAIDDAVLRILRMKARFGILDGLPPVDPSEIESTAHHALALEAAEKAIVLLKNDRVLPLDRARLGSVVVVGPLASLANLGDELGSPAVDPSHAVSPLEGIMAHAGALRIDLVANSTLSAADVATVQAAGAAIVIAGLTDKDEGENTLRGWGDRLNLGLSKSAIAMIQAVAAANARTVVVLEGGSAITVEEWIDQVPGLLMAWYPGMEGGNAIAEVLFGDVNPSGKLPVTFPRSLDQLPPFVANQDEVQYGYYHGYRYVDQSGTSPRFPFGFGLSYTSFAFDQLAVDSSASTVSARVTNTGTVAGDEIAQLYVGFPGSKVDRPVRVLVGFSRVHLMPGEAKTVSFSVDPSDLAYWDTASAAFKVEPIELAVTVGSSSRDLPLAGKLAPH